MDAWAAAQFAQQRDLVVHDDLLLERGLSEFRRAAVFDVSRTPSEPNSMT
jgi:hypothetical protein